MNKFILGLSLILLPFISYADATDDNEINIDQEGDTLVLYIDQIGYGNKMGLNNFANGSSAMPIICLLYTSPSPRDKHRSRMPSSA